MYFFFAVRDILNLRWGKLEASEGQLKISFGLKVTTFYFTSNHAQIIYFTSRFPYL